LFIARFRRLSIAAYLLMGWASLVAVKPMLANIPRGGVYLLAGGGLLYTAGLVFYLWKRLPYGHLIWHLFVLGGSAAHFFAILLYLLPMG
jgi:hemolysin III